MVVITDIRAFYESAVHRWMIDHIPINKTMLRKFLKAGVVRNGELFDTDEGMSMGISIAPLLANMIWTAYRPISTTIYTQARIRNRAMPMERFIAGLTTSSLRQILGIREKKS